MKRHFLYTTAFLGLLISFSWGCKESITICPSDQVPYLKCTFSYSDDFETDTFVITMIDLDSVLYASKSGPSKLSIPLQFDKEQTDFQFLFHKDTVDNITIKHTPNVVFNSPECAFIVSFDMDSIIPYTQERIDTILFLNPIIDQNTYENIEISF